MLDYHNISWREKTPVFDFYVNKEEGILTVYYYDEYTTYSKVEDLKVKLEEIFNSSLLLEEIRILEKKEITEQK